MKRCLRVVHLSASAQAIPNASFEANSFTNFPGYVSTNGSIAGWTASPANRDGLNPTTNSPIANNGAIPNGTNVAFTQSRGDLSTLSNTTTGLTVGNRHRVIFRANRRSGVGLTTNSTWSLKGGAFVSFKSSLTAIVIAQTSTGRVYGLFANTNLLLYPQAWTPVPPDQIGPASILMFRRDE